MSPNSTKAGAAALVHLLQTIVEQVDRDYEPHYPDELESEDDPTDYFGIAGMIEESVRASIVDAPQKHREGYLRALAELFAGISTGVPCGLLEDGQWDPLACTRRSFAVARLSRAALARHAE